MRLVLALMSKLFKPDLEVLILESWDAIAQGSSSAWNNAGNAHWALSELNYGSESWDGAVSIEKAIAICK